MHLEGDGEGVAHDIAQPDIVHGRAPRCSGFAFPNCLLSPCWTTVVASKRLQEGQTPKSHDTGLSASDRLRCICRRLYSVAAEITSNLKDPRFSPLARGKNDPAKPSGSTSEHFLLSTDRSPSELPHTPPS